MLVKETLYPLSLLLSPNPSLSLNIRLHTASEAVKDNGWGACLSGTQGMDTLNRLGRHSSLLSNVLSVLSPCALCTYV